jgi:hypothetical protein
MNAARSQLPGASLVGAGPAKSLVRVACDAGGTPTELLLEFLSKYTAQRYPGQLGQRLPVAAYELIENGIQYGSVAKEVIFEMLERDGWVELRVANEAVAARVSRLREQIAKIAADPSKAYAEAMHRSLNGGKPMLGLARVSHECRMQLHLEEGSAGEVLVVARCRR